MTALQKGETRVLGGGAGFGAHIKSNSQHCLGGRRAVQAEHGVAGEKLAFDYLARLHAQRLEVDELAAVVAMLRDAVSLAGFCRVIERALGVRHG